MQWLISVSGACTDSIHSFLFSSLYASPSSMENPSRHESPHDVAWPPQCHLLSDPPFYSPGQNCICKLYSPSTCSDYILSFYKKHKNELTSALTQILMLAWTFIYHFHFYFDQLAWKWRNACNHIQCLYKNFLVRTINPFRIPWKCKFKYLRLYRRVCPSSLDGFHVTDEENYPNTTSVSFQVGIFFIRASIFYPCDHSFFRPPVGAFCWHLPPDMSDLTKPFFLLRRERFLENEPRRTIFPEFTLKERLGLP